MLHCAVQAGVAAASKYGGAVAGSRTMLDALIPAANALLEAANAGAPCKSKFFKCVRLCVLMGVGSVSGAVGGYFTLVTL